MAWVKISDDNGGVFAKKLDFDQVEVVSISELESQVEWIKTQGIKTEPDQETLEFFNSHGGRAALYADLLRIQKTIDELKAIE